MKKVYHLVFNIATILFSAICFGQTVTENERPQMADGLRSSGKIYVVVVVVVTILLGLVFYLIQLDRKIKKLEAGEDKKLTS